MSWQDVENIYLSTSGGKIEKNWSINVSKCFWYNFVNNDDKWSELLIKNEL